MPNPAKTVRIGTMIKATEGEATLNIAAIADLGFESFEPFFWQTTNGQDLSELGKRCLGAIPQQCSIGSDDAPCGFPTGRRTFSNP